ncbi:uncharacterized protein LOC113228446 isoform X2 [Hyposmocoma kahamanoa]|uniref:uncharacterized protein LOC113228446 isoform X2 n=1 Tax=Hyposmocoma kahamanoa TaxID=1477025 RepID=UPI000E6D71B5|nr:uncharacterized protein LOC113228446 isoform X2 [Hyposmocoma kahamanoa]
MMRGRSRSSISRSKERANMSFFIFIMFFAVFGVIMVTEFLLLEKHNGPARSRYEELQGSMRQNRVLPSDLKKYFLNDLRTTFIPASSLSALKQTITNNVLTPFISTSNYCSIKQDPVRLTALKQTTLNNNVLIPFMWTSNYWSITRDPVRLSALKQTISNNILTPFTSTSNYWWLRRDPVRLSALKQTTLNNVLTPFMWISNYWSIRQDPISLSALKQKILNYLLSPFASALIYSWDGKASHEGVTEKQLPAQAPQDAVWQPVAGTRFKFYVYSAYVERRTVAAVRVIGATKTRGADSVFCRIWLPDNRTITLRAKVQTIRENWNLKYSAVYVLCLLSKTGVKPKDTIGATVAVIATADAATPPSNLLTVIDTKPKPGIEGALHVCVKPFHFHYGRSEWLIEWMELNRLLGVSHFYMYNKTMSEQTTCLLNHYREHYGLVTLLPWNLPIISVTEIRTEGQFAAFQDCLYRSMSSAKWLLVVDTDEVLIPRRERTLPALLEGLSASYAPAKVPAAFLFRNAFFYVLWEDDPQAPAKLLTACKTRRWTTPHVLKNRSKYVVRPRHAVELGNHFTWELLPGATSVGVPKDLALLHHYRLNCEFGGMSCVKVPSTVDRTAHQWSEELMKRVTAEKKLLAKACPKIFPA